MAYVSFELFFLDLPALLSKLELMKKPSSNAAPRIPPKPKAKKPNKKAAIAPSKVKNFSPIDAPETSAEPNAAASNCCGGISNNGFYLYP